MLKGRSTLAVSASVGARFVRQIPAPPIAVMEGNIMSNRTIVTLAAGVILMAFGSAASAVDRAQMSGEQLFNFHSCVNCHGTQGKDPVSRLVPKIGGMAATEIQEKAARILRGETDSEAAKLMHSAVAYSQACDAPPSTAEIQKIAEWLSTL
jgi:cytochrome c553